MKASAPFSLGKMRALNGNAFSDADYIYYVMRENYVGEDFVGALFRFINPKFEQIEDRFLVVPAGAPEKYRTLRTQGQPPEEAQYWANLTEISGLLGNTDLEQLGTIAAEIAKCWQMNLMDASKDFSQRAHVVKNTLDNEIYVTISGLQR